LLKNYKFKKTKYYLKDKNISSFERKRMSLRVQMFTC